MRPTIQYKLAGLRVKNGMTKEQMAEKLNITARSYNNKESGITEFKLKEVFIISEMFQLPVESIFLDEKLVSSEVFPDLEESKSLGVNFDV